MLPIMRSITYSKDIIYHDSCCYEKTLHLNAFREKIFLNFHRVCLIEANVVVEPVFSFKLRILEGC